MHEHHGRQSERSDFYLLPGRELHEPANYTSPSFSFDKCSNGYLANMMPYHRTAPSDTASHLKSMRSYGSCLPTLAAISYTVCSEELSQAATQDTARKGYTGAMYM